MVLDASFSLDSPLVEARFGGPDSGSTALAAVGMAPFLKHADIESLYTTLDGDGVVALTGSRRKSAWAFNPNTLTSIQSPA